MIVAKTEQQTECTYYLKPYEVAKAAKLVSEAEKLERNLKAGLEQSLEAQWRWQFGQSPVHYEFLKAISRYKKLYNQAMARRMRRRMSGVAACQNIQDADLRVAANEVVDLARWKGNVDFFSPCGRNEGRIAIRDGRWTFSQHMRSPDGTEVSKVYRNVSEDWILRELTMGNISIGWRVSL